VSAVKSPPKEKRPSERFSFDRLLPVTDLQPLPVADTRHYQLLHVARQSFRCCTAPGTTRKRANDSTTALQSIRRASARFYLDHSPPLRPFNHLTDKARHRATKRGSRSGSCVSHTLRFMGHVAIGCYSEDTTAVCSHLPARHSFRTRFLRARFRRTERRSFLLPVGYGFSRFGTVSHETYWQALAGLSWLSSSPSRDLRAIAETVGPGSACHQAKAPHASQVERTNELARTP
jgi:hypothetical protein